MKALLPPLIEERTTPSALMDGAQASRFDMKPVGCTKVKAPPLARTAASPRSCHAPMASPCCTSMEESLTRCFTPAALAAFAAALSRAGISGPVLTRNNSSTPLSGVLSDSGSARLPTDTSTRSPKSDLAFCASRTNPRGRSPLWIKSSTTLDPMSPVAPVMRYFIVLSYAIMNVAHILIEGYDGVTPMYTRLLNADILRKPIAIREYL